MNMQIPADTFGFFRSPGFRGTITRTTKYGWCPLLFYHTGGDDKSYFVLFPGFVPLYGRQLAGASHREAFGLIAFWREYDDAKKRHEYSVLWPFINMYYDPAEYGGRFFSAFLVQT